MLTKEEFNKGLEKITLLWAQRNFELAFEQVEIILRDGTEVMRAEAKFFAGLMKQDQGLIAHARENWLDALPLAEEGTFLLYLLEHNIGASYEQEGSDDEALVWYRSALRTCAQGDRFSDDQTLTAFLALNKGEIPTKDEDVVAIGVKKSWETLGLQGNPDLSDLPGAISKLAKGYAELEVETMGED